MPSSIPTLNLWQRARRTQKRWARAHKRAASKKRSVLDAARRRLRPLPELSLSEWMERELRLPKEVSTEAGRMQLYPFQRGIADAISDPTIERVSVIKSARVGMTTLLVGAMGYRAQRSGGNMLLVQPTVDDAAGFGRDQFVPIVRMSPALNRLFPIEKSRDKSQTLRRKEYRGGVLHMVGANSGTGFRRILAPWILLDEVDAYPPSAGDDGDPVKLAEQRGVTAWDRKIVAVSTPLVAKRSRIETLFKMGDQRRFYVPCPHCGHEDFLSFSERVDNRGHWMQWPENQPELAYFVCRANGCIIEESSKAAMLAAGHWHADASVDGHASFHIWAAYSPHPKARWGMIAAEFLEAKAGGPHQLKVFVNTVLGETWQESGEAPDWERLYARREQYPIGSVPDGVEVLVCGVDVAPIRGKFDYEVVGYGLDKQSWSIEWGQIYGDMGADATWAKLDQLLSREFRRADGTVMTIRRLAIDSGAATNQVYNWCRRHGPDRVLSVKGKDTARALINAGKPVDVTVHGRILKHGHRVFIMGTDMAKNELYSWLRMRRPDAGEDYPAGWCHFPEYPEQYFRELTAEHLVAEADKKGYIKLVWKKLPGRENEVLDCRGLARAAVASLGLDRVSRPGPAAARPAPKKPPPPPPSAPSGGWLGGRGRRGRGLGGGGGGGGGRGGGWLGGGRRRR